MAEAMHWGVPCTAGCCQLFALPHQLGFPIQLKWELRGNKPGHQNHHLLLIPCAVQVVSTVTFPSLRGHSASLHLSGQVPGQRQ